MPEGVETDGESLGHSASDEDVDAYKPMLPPSEPVEEGYMEDVDEEHCSICLQPLSDRTIVPACSHEFCFECLLVWTEQSRRCPLCSGQIGEYLIHDIRSKHDFTKHYLNPLRTSPRPDPLVSHVSGTQRRSQRREVLWGRNERRERERERRAADELERAIAKRRWIYRHSLYTKHVASNPYTRYKPFPTPAQFSSNPDLISRATIFVRRELRIWDALDVEFLTTFTISLMKSIDIRSESAVKLLAEFLDMDTGSRSNAEHFAHELYCYLRSPYRDLARYDAAVQYDHPEHVPAMEYRQRSRRWEENSVPASPSTSVSAEPSRLYSGSSSPARTRHGSVGGEGGSSMEHNKRPLLQSPEVESMSRVGHRDYRRRNIGPSDQDAIARDVKGKGRAIDSDYVDPNPPSTIDHRVGNVQPSVSSREEKLLCSEGSVATEDVTAVSSSRDSSSVVEESHKASNRKQRERPTVRREALQAMNAQLLDSSRGYGTSKPAIVRGQESSSTPQRDEIPPTMELSIRGAAKMTAIASPIPSIPSPDFSREPNGQAAHYATHSATVSLGMSSRDIMARTRARLAKLSQEPTLSTGTISPKRGDHDVSSLIASSDIPSTPHNAAVVGNHSMTPSPTTNSLSSPIVTQLDDVSAAQMSLPNSIDIRMGDTRDAVATAAMHRRARLLSKLENEKHVQSGENNPHHHARLSIPVATEEGLPENIGTSKQSQTEEELSLDRQDAEMLEKKLRGQAQLRIKLAAAKRDLAGAAVLANDATSSADGHNLVSRESHLRSQLKRAVPR